ncbi:hypothetical protein OROMI_031595 [Orobanche minor]
MFSSSSPSIILQKSRTPAITSLLHNPPLAIASPRNLRFPPLTRTFIVNTSKYPSFSSQPVYDYVSQPQPDDEDEPAIGDCLVYEEGVFEDPFLQNTRHLINDDVSAPPVRKSSSKDTTKDVQPEILIPEKWLDIQKEINISKKERRRISQQLDYGTRVQKRRQALMPINPNPDEFEIFKNEKLQQLKPSVLDEPEPPEHLEENSNEHLEENSNKYEEKRGDDEQRIGEVVTGRVTRGNPRLAVYGGGLEDISAVFSSGRYDHGAATEKSQGRVTPRNPRLAVYGGSLEDISAVFSSGSYDHGATEKSEGTRKLFSKEEKLLMNRRVPDLTVAISVEYLGKWHPLHTLVASGEFYLMNSLLKHNLDINAPDKNGLTAIHKSILGRKQAIFNFLLRESANPFVRDDFCKRTIKTFCQLLYMGEELLYLMEGASLMHYAVFTASTQMIKILLLYNVDINLQDSDGWTPLHLAVQSRRTDIIRLLLIKGADKSLKNRLPKLAGNSDYV